MSSSVEKRDPLSDAWWEGMPNRACIVDYTVDGHTISSAAELEDARGGGVTTLRFRVFSVTGPYPATPPSEVRLLSVVGGSSYAFLLRVIEFSVEYLVVDAQPVSFTRRPLRRVPRAPYRLGPCTAVVHSAVRQWRGLVEFWVNDVSAQGVGFAVVTRHADRLAVGDSLRAPVTLPDGQRSWIDGDVVWLTPDGRGGLRTRRAPQWRIETDSPGTRAIA